MLSGCSGTSGNISEGQDAHLLSVNVEVIEKIEDGNEAFRGADCIGVICFDIVQYDLNGQIIRRLEKE